MAQASRGRGARRLVPVAIATFALVGGSAAIAAEGASGSEGGLLKFANVTMVDAPTSTGTPASSTPAGMRAYKDSATSALRGPSPEEMQAAAAESRSPATTRRRAAVAAEAGSAGGFAANGGGVGYVVDESYLQYSVVVRQPDGSLAEVCVTGRDQADAIQAKQPVLSKKELVDAR